MKKIIKIGIAALTCGIAFAGVMTMTQTKVFANEIHSKELVIDNTKKESNYDVIKGKCTFDDGKSYDMYYSDQFFTKDPASYQPHMATLASNLTNSSTTYITKGDYSDGAHNIKAALTSIGFDNMFVSDSYNKKPTTDSIGCVIANKKLENKGDMKYDYAVDITIRSASYEAEWASNVTLGKTGEAAGFKQAAETVINDYFSKYLIKYSEIEKALVKGKVAFFINGYSRGGATANLTAKKLIDKYQPAGNGVYAYCLEAPQGGIKSEINKDRDYKGIHNVINPNDLVCYVAPTAMGFVRYGVDHFVGGKTVAQEDKAKYGTSLFNSDSDNVFDRENYEKNKELVKKELQKILKTDNVDKYLPYDVQQKKLDLRNFTIQDVPGGRTDYFINYFIQSLQVKGGLVRIDRNKYNESLEQPIRRLLEALNKDVDLIDIKNCDNIVPVYDAFVHLLGKFIGNVKVSYKDSNIFKLIWKFIKGDKNLTYTLDFTDNMRRDIASTVVKTLEQQKKLTDLLDKHYPTKAAGAMSDIKNVLYEMLSGGNRLDDLITFGANAKGIFQNHAMYQTLAWLQLEDSWTK